jgi:hypothetical protein
VVPRVWLPKFRLLTVRLTAGPPPVPVRLMVCGLPVALSAMDSTADRVPFAVGLKVTLMVQLPLAATEPPQVLVWAKSPALAPVKLRPETVSMTLPVLLSVTVCAALVVPTDWELNVKLVAERLTAEEVPVPERPIVCGLLAALSVIVTAAVSAASSDGLKTTLIVQLDPAVTDPPQLSDSVKSLAFVPVTETVGVSVALPVLLTVAVWTELVVPSDTLPNVRLVVDRPATAAVPVPVPESATICGLLLALSFRARVAVRLPAELGVNVTAIVQLAPAASTEPQPLVAAKSLALVPVIVTPLMLSAALPVLLTVTDWALLAVAMF